MSYESGRVSYKLGDRSYELREEFEIRNSWKK